MKEYICTETVVPLRTGPSHRSDMGSQVLLGERFSVTASAGSWTRITLSGDEYSGWVDNDHFTLTPNTCTDNPEVITVDFSATREDGSIVNIYCGSEIYEVSNDRKHFRVGNQLYQSEKPVPVQQPEPDMVSTAGRFLNAPYLWGGRTLHGIDCSGLTQLVCKLHGKHIPRDSFRQAEHGTTINLLSDAIAGDLLFFDNNAGKITHVGMLYDWEHIIHASGIVRIDPVDHQGIFKPESGRYSHKLRIIKRY